MSQNKLRVIKDYEKLDASLQKRIKEAYPYGFNDELITITGKDGALIRALPFETEDRYYLVKFPAGNAAEIEDDDDFDSEVIVKSSKKPDLGKDFDDDFSSDEEEENDSYDEPYDDEDDDDED
ncbi:MAG: hypothetical protein JW717_14860 [Marinilabiliaceae bacterium]|nr:hypothetical protein [Marinilabiliaceae bacterium]